MPNLATVSFEWNTDVFLKAGPRVNTRDPCAQVPRFRPAGEKRIAQPPVGENRKSEIGDREVLDEIIAAFEQPVENGVNLTELLRARGDHRLVMLLPRRADGAEKQRAFHRN